MSTLFFSFGIAMALVLFIVMRRHTSSGYSPVSYVWTGLSLLVFFLTYKAFLLFFKFTPMPPVPLGLLYPTVFLLSAYQYYTGKVPSLRLMMWCFVPNVVFGLCYPMLWLNESIFQQFAPIYVTCYYIVAVVYCFAAIFYVITLLRKYPLMSGLFDILLARSVFFAVGLCLIGLLMFCEYVFSVNYGFDPQMLFYPFISFGGLVLVHYLYVCSKRDKGDNIGQEVAFDGRLSPTETKMDTRAKTSPGFQIDDELLLLKADVDRLMKQESLFLRPDLSMESLAEVSGIPPYRLSQLFSQCYGTNFYHVVAAYRIDYAIAKIENGTGGDQTLEALSEECGFNSKTSFNRYFKEFTGTTPSLFKAFGAKVTKLPLAFGGRVHS